jgi:hypothetical protein
MLSARVSGCAGSSTVAVALVAVAVAVPVSVAVAVLVAVPVPLGELPPPLHAARMGSTSAGTTTRTDTSDDRCIGDLLRGASMSVIAALGISLVAGGRLRWSA